MVRPTCLRIGGRLGGPGLCRAGGGSYLGGAIRGEVRGWSEARKPTPLVSGLAKAGRAPPLLGDGLHLGGSVRGGARERGGAARASSRPLLSGLVEAQRAPPPRARLGMPPGGAWGGRGSLWLLQAGSSRWTPSRDASAGPLCGSWAEAEGWRMCGWP